MTLTLIHTAAVDAESHADLDQHDFECKAGGLDLNPYRYLDYLDLNARTERFFDFVKLYEPEEERTFLDITDLIGTDIDTRLLGRWVGGPGNWTKQPVSVETAIGVNWTAKQDELRYGRELTEIDSIEIDGKTVTIVNDPGAAIDDAPPHAPEAAPRLATESPEAYWERRATEITGISMNEGLDDSELDDEDSYRTTDIVLDHDRDEYDVITTFVPQNGRQPRYVYDEWLNIIDLEWVTVPEVEALPPATPVVTSQVRGRPLTVNVDPINRAVSVTKRHGDQIYLKGFKHLNTPQPSTKPSTTLELGLEEGARQAGQRVTDAHRAAGFHVTYTERPEKLRQMVKLQGRFVSYGIDTPGAERRSKTFPTAAEAVEAFRALVSHLERKGYRVRTWTPAAA